MNYCWRSDDDCGCDLCVFDGDGFITIHVAARRVVYEPISLPSAGQTFHEETAEAALARLRWLRALGYRFPDSVLEELECAATEDA